MADNTPKRGVAEMDRINVQEPYELRGWSDKFEVTSERLKEAVEKVGAMVKDVEKELAG